MSKKIEVCKLPDFDTGEESYFCSYSCAEGDDYHDIIELDNKIDSEEILELNGGTCDQCKKTIKTLPSNSGGGE